MKLTRLQTAINDTDLHITQFEVADKDALKVAQMAHFITQDLSEYFETGVMNHSQYFDVGDFNGKAYATFFVTGRKHVMRANLEIFKASYRRAKKADSGKDCPCDSCDGGWM